MAIAMTYKVPFVASRAFDKFLPSNLLFENTPEGLSKKLNEFFISPSLITEACNIFAKDRSWPELSKTMHNIYGSKKLVDTLKT